MVSNIYDVGDLLKIAGNIAIKLLGLAMCLENG